MLKKIFNFQEYDFRYYNVPALFVVFLISFIGLTVIEVLQDPVDKLYERQIFGIVLGIVVALILSLIDYHLICKFYIILYLFNLGLLVATRLFGKAYYDAKRWLVLPKIGQIQPSEFSKLLLILFWAAILAKFHKKLNKIPFLLVLCILSALPLVLILEQPDLSTTIALGLVFVSIVFLSGLTYKIIIPLLLVAIPAILGLWWYIQQDFQVLLHPYQQKRILALKYPDLYPDLMWQQENAAKAIRSGGLTGKFLTEGADASNMLCANLPAIESDFIFSAISEAYGFIGGCVLLGLIVFFVIRAFRTAIRAKDQLGTLIAGGIGAMIAVQTVINVCVNTSLFPNTGIPLPFTSSGLSSLLGNYMMVGVLMNVSLQLKPKTKEEL
ncbi:MAG: FtsW/RodA/SpoVE family cell cycle protein [Lachnospiraceae bacterium]|nr:FtsW/RodA/SpoVE family cell cycle protein [Lachnospiraceae bacterium]